ncbi:guanylate kinase [Patescibacteria group bacterium]|nr:guanylate kinase [Patescibacteria group bacterium]
MTSKRIKKNKPNKRTNCAKLFIISGPSGAGKNAVVCGILKKLKNASRMVTCTTRKKRPNEKPGKDYYFLTEKEFKQRIKESDFLEWAIVHKKHYYGNSKKILEKLQKKYAIILLVIDVQGAKTIRKKAIPHTSIFINAESEKKLISRIKKRKAMMSNESLKLRLASAAAEMKQAKKYDYQVTNYENRLDETIERVCAIIQKN